MNDLDWRVDEAPQAGDLAAVAQAVLAHGLAVSGGSPRPLASLVRRDGVLIGGATGRMEFARLFVQYLWVREDHRRQGLGSRLLDRLEQAAAGQGCRDALIETLSDETAALYVRRGYVALATLPGYVGPYTRHVLLKPLA